MNGVCEVEAETQDSHRPGSDVFVTPVERLLRATHTAISSECLETRTLAEFGENDDIVPEGELLGTKPGLAKPSFELGNLRAFAGTIDS